MSSRNGIWFTSFALVLLLAGASIGIVVDRLWLLPPPPAAGRILDDAGLLSRIGPRSIEMLQRRLDLTADQRTRLEVVLKDWSVRTAALQDGLREQFLESQRGLRTDIEGVLTPDQIEKFKSLPWIERRPGPGGGRSGFGPGGRRGGGPPLGPGRRGRE
jgi:hypothetical protein